MKNNKSFEKYTHQVILSKNPQQNDPTEEEEEEQKKSHDDGSKKVSVQETC
jgi:hypothetical protein